jgi:hypothetical protein
VLGGVIGLVLAAAAAYRSTARRGCRWQFFTASGIVVIVLAAGLLSSKLNGCRRRNHRNGLSAWDFEGSLSMTSTLGKFLHTVLELQRRRH